MYNNHSIPYCKNQAFRMQYHNFAMSIILFMAIDPLQAFAFQLHIKKRAPHTLQRPFF